MRLHFEDRPFSYLRVAPLPELRKPTPKAAYKGKIYETVFVPVDANAAKRLGFPESYTYRHGVTNSGFRLSLHWAIQRKHPEVRKGSEPQRVQSLVSYGSDSSDRKDWGNELEVRSPNASPLWKEKVVYRLHSTTYAPVATELKAAQAGNPARKRSRRVA